MRERITVACVQAEPVVLDREATIDKLDALTAEAKAAGAALVVFPETFIPAYPALGLGERLAGWADPRAKGGVREARAGVGRDPGPGCRPARRDRRGARGLARHRRQRARPAARTLYNALLYHSPGRERWRSTTASSCRRTTSA